MSGKCLFLQLPNWSQKLDILHSLYNDDIYSYTIFLNNAEHSKFVDVDTNSICYFVDSDNYISHLQLISLFCSMKCFKLAILRLAVMKKSFILLN